MNAIAWKQSLELFLKFTNGQYGRNIKKQLEIFVKTDFNWRESYDKYTNRQYHQEAMQHETSYGKMNGVVIGGACEDGLSHASHMDGFDK